MTTVPHGPAAGNRLVIFAPNWLGDAVMALPAIHDVQRAAGDTPIWVAARPSIAALFQLIDGVQTVPAAVDTLRAQSFDTALLLPNSFNAALLARRAGIGERWGYRADWRGPLLTRAVKRPPRGHQADYYRHLTASLGWAGDAERPMLTVNDAIRRAAANLLTSSGWKAGSPLVALAPGAANGRAKQWPAESYADLVQSLAHDGVTLVAVGAAGDASAGRELVRALQNRDATLLSSTSPRFINLIGRTDLPTLAGVLIHCRALVANDSGAMHLAAALGVAVTAMFGPSNERETRPLGDPSRTAVLTHPVWCRPCMLRECPLDHRCMRGISVGAVVAATRGLL